MILYLAEENVANRLLSVKVIALKLNILLVDDYVCIKYIKILLEN